MPAGARPHRVNMRPEGVLMCMVPPQEGRKDRQGDDTR